MPCPDEIAFPDFLGKSTIVPIACVLDQQRENAALSLAVAGTATKLGRNHSVIDVMHYG